MGAAAHMVIAADCGFIRAAAPAEAEVAILIQAATSASLWARVVVVTDTSGAGGIYRRWGRGTRIWGILAFLGGIRNLHCYATLAGWSVNIALHLDVAILSPAWPPGVPHKPVVLAIFCAVANSNHPMIQLGSTASSEYTLYKHWRRIRKFCFFATPLAFIDEN